MTFDHFALACGMSFHAYSMDIRLEPVAYNKVALMIYITTSVIARWNRNPAGTSWVSCKKDSKLSRRLVDRVLLHEVRVTVDFLAHLETN